MALREHLVEAEDSQLAPFPAEGARMAFQGRPGQPWVPVTVILVNDGMGWCVTLALTGH